MVTTATNRLSLVWILTILTAKYQLVNMGPTDARLTGGLHPISSTSVPENETFNEFGADNINASLANPDVKRVDSVKILNNESVTPSHESTTSIGLHSSTFQSSSSSKESIGTEATSVTESSPSPLSPTINPSELSTESPELSAPPAFRAVREKINCPSNSSDECEKAKKCFNLKGPCSDYCKKNPCFQSKDEEDQHYCINYFTGRLCVDKLTEGYRYVKGVRDVMKRIDKEDSQNAEFMEILKKVVLFQRKDTGIRLVDTWVPEVYACTTWDLDLKTYGPFEDDHLKVDSLVIEQNSTAIQVSTNELLIPHAAMISVTCMNGGENTFTKRTYLTFIPLLHWFLKTPPLPVSPSEVVDEVESTEGFLNIAKYQKV